MILLWHGILDSYSTLLGVWSIVINPSVCVSICVFVCLCVHEHISGTAGPIHTKFCAQIPCGRGSVPLWRRCATLCTSGFTDDVIFGCRVVHRMSMHGPIVAKYSAPRGIARLGRSLMSMNALLLCAYIYQDLFRQNFTTVWHSMQPVLKVDCYSSLPVQVSDICCLMAAQLTSASSTSSKSASQMVSQISVATSGSSTAVAVEKRLSSAKEKKGYSFPC